MLPPSATPTPSLIQTLSKAIGIFPDRGLGAAPFYNGQAKGVKEKGPGPTACSAVTMPPLFARFPGDVGGSLSGALDDSASVPQFLEGLRGGLPERRGRIDVSRLPERRLGVLQFAGA